MLFIIISVINKGKKVGVNQRYLLKLYFGIVAWLITPNCLQVYLDFKFF